MKHKLITSLIILAALPSTAASLYTSGHGDIGVAYVGGALELHYHLEPDAVVDGVPVGNPPDGVEFESDELITIVPDPSVPRPPGAEWNFIGTAAFNPVWFLPLAEDPNKPFLGISREELAPAQWTGVSLSLTSMNGPTGGHFSLFDDDGFGNPIVRFATSDGITPADSFTLAGGHAHYAWAFTQPGTYELEFTISGTHATDGFKTASATFTFGVAIPEPSTALLGLAAAGVFLRRRRL